MAVEKGLIDADAVRMGHLTARYMKLLNDSDVSKGGFEVPNICRPDG